MPTESPDPIPAPAGQPDPALARTLADTLAQSALGKSSAYVDEYDPGLLFPIPRAGKRAELGIVGSAPFFGADLWTAFELSWLNLRGKPPLDAEFAKPHSG